MWGGRVVTDMFASDRWDPDRMMDGSYGGMMGGGAWVMLLVWMLLLGLVVAAVVWAVRASDVRASSGTSHDRPRTPSPREELDLRLARGEVSPEEYETIRALLGS
jgi:putative membrane protein